MKSGSKSNVSFLKKKVFEIKIKKHNAKILERKKIFDLETYSIKGFF